MVDSLFILTCFFGKFYVSQKVHSKKCWVISTQLWVKYGLTQQLEEHNIAFSATLGNRGDVGPFNTNFPLVYQKVFLNAGSCYNTGTGIFTAPVKGVYFFSLSGHNKTSKPMALRLFKNGEPMTGVYNHPLTDAGIRYESLSTSITLMLEKGDQVFVHLLANAWVFDNNDNLTLFTGHLVFPL
uniref:Cerebellin 7 n=1 Tax=Sinocyclocheilus rhinocerous TaxID=307959 RepID=A0A673ICG7_9TELE